MRLLACLLVAAGLAAAAPVGATTSVRCPGNRSLGTVRFVRAGRLHSVSLATCVDRIAGRAAPAARGTVRSPDGRYVASVRSTGAGKSAKQTIWILDRRTGRSRPIASETESYTQIGPGDTPGPIILLRFSTDNRWFFF